MKKQEPLRPFPYFEKEVQFTNPKDGTTLYGTITYPSENGEYPAVVLVTGSGAQNRDEEILGHKPFLVIADYLTRSGIVVLRYDDRHFKMSVKEGWKFTTMDLAGDAKAAIDFLATFPFVDTTCIGIAGHSEGGVIAPIVASENSTVAFVISLAGSALKGYDISMKQAQDLTANEKECQLQKEASKIIIEEPDILKRKKKVKKLNSAIYGRFNLKARYTLHLWLDMIVSEWNKFFIEYDPSVAWKKVTCPVLALNGEYDIQVHADENLNAIEMALKEGKNTDYTIVKIEKANHLFQVIPYEKIENQSMMLNQYMNSEETISPQVLEIIRNWITARFPKTTIQ